MARTSNAADAVNTLQNEAHQRLEFDRPDGARIFVAVFAPPEEDHRHDDEGAVEQTPILILDGIGCSGWAWQKIIPSLARRRRVALVHHRGHGQSPVPPRPWNLAMHTLADDAAAVAERLEFGPAIVVGFSMGFQVALELYRRHPEQVAGLVSVAGPCGSPLSTFGGSGWAAQVMPLISAASRVASKTYGRIWKRLLPSRLVRDIGLWTAVDAGRIDPGDFELYFRQMSKLEPALFVSMLERAQAHDANDVLKDVKVPTMIIAGGRDGFVPADELRRIAHTIPSAQWCYMPHATHALPAEYPAEILELLETFAGELSSRATSKR